MSQIDIPNSRQVDIAIARLQVPSTCRKRAYRTRRKAIVARDRIRSASKAKTGAELTRCYECPDCGLWHLTSQR